MSNNGLLAIMVKKKKIVKSAISITNRTEMTGVRMMPSGMHNVQLYSCICHFSVHSSGMQLVYNGSTGMGKSLERDQCNLHLKILSLLPTLAIWFQLTLRILIIWAIPDLPDLQ